MNKFSIIVPTLNSYKILINLVDSIKSQTWNNWEVFFVDGESNHNHTNYLKKLCFGDKRFLFYKQSKTYKGIFGAMNQGIEIIDKNSWFLFLGSDDKLRDNYTLEKLNIKINSFGSNNIDLLICRGIYSDIRNNNYTRDAYFINKKNDSILNLESYKKLIFKGFTPPHQTTLFNGNSEIISEKYNENFKVAADLEFFCRLAQSKKKLCIANVPLEIICISTGGVSNKNHFLRVKEVILCYLKYFKFRFIFPFFRRYYNRYKQLL